MRRLSFLILLFSVGCNSALDEKQFQVRQEGHEANRLFLATCRVYQKGANEMADKKFLLEDSAVEKDWKDFLERHTDENGGLVSKTPDGRIVPMPVTQLILAMEKRQEAKMRVVEGKKSWQSFNENFTNMLAKAEALNEVAKQQEIDVMEAKRSAQTLATQAVNTLMSLASGLGLGFAVVP